MKLTRTHTICPGLLAALAFATLSPVPAFAQLNGDNVLGDTGVNNGTQAPPGVYLGGVYYQYRSDTIRRADGTRLVLNPSQPADVSVPFVAPTLLYVSKMKFLGGNYGLLVAPGYAGGSLEAPAYGFARTKRVATSDTYVAPFMLGWHLSRADVNTAFAVFAPTGRYTPGGFDNTGRGMWAYETSGGATVYLDAVKQWTAATSGFFENHGKKEGTAVVLGDQVALGGVRVGDILTLEGGAARQFEEGSAHVGIAYYAQWKLTADDFGVTLPNGAILSKHRVFGLGPDVTVPIATTSVLLAFVNVRYFWELGAEVKTQGQSLVVAATFPVPGIAIGKAK